MASKPKRKPMKSEFPNPRYTGATPEMVGLAFLRHEPDAEADGGEAESERSGIIDQPAVRSGI